MRGGVPGGASGGKDAVRALTKGEPVTVAYDKARLEARTRFARWAAAEALSACGWHWHSARARIRMGGGCDVGFRGGCEL